MKKTLLLCLFSCAMTQLWAQSSHVWHQISENDVQLKQYMKRNVQPLHFSAFELDFVSLEKILRTAPMEMTEAARNNTFIIELPMPNGAMEAFKVVNSPIAEPEYMATHPELAAYAGSALNHSGWSMRMTTTPSGFDAVITTDEGQVYIENLASDQKKYYQVYYTKDIDFSKITLSGPVKCGVSHTDKGEDIVKEAQHFTSRSGMGEFVTIRKYRLAAATTGEFAALHGGTKAAVKDHLFKVINKVNEVLGKEVAIRLSLIAKNDTLIYTDKNKDPYPTGNSGGSMVGSNTMTLSNVVGNANFDFGHVFTGSCTDVGGVASGLICSQQGKGNGVSCDQSAQVDLLAVTITAHEMGHQMTASHTMSDCQGVAPAQLSSSSKIEPGSGTTIMSYDGGCGNQDITGIYWKPNGYYHAGSLDQIINYTRFNVGNNCAQKLTSTDNHIPIVETNYVNGFYIPILTPFQLVGKGSDMDGDSLLYIWDQFDIGVQTPLGKPNGNSASFRSFAPSAAGKVRTLPSMSNIVDGSVPKAEFLPTFDRKFTFRLIARDGKAEGGTAWSEIKFKASEKAGPFLVGFPNTAKDTLTANKYTEIKWNVANTDGTLVNCQKVNIGLSTDGGYTYPTTLLANTDNDGSEFVLIPDITSKKARIRVMAADNIFFDISDKDVQIVKAAAPSYSINYNIANKQVCLPGASYIDVKTTALGGFTKDVTLEIIGGLPNKTAATFVKNPLPAGEATKLNLDFSKTDTTGFFNIKIRATSDGVVTERTVPIKVVANDFSTIAMEMPSNGQTGIGTLPNFAWKGSFNASRYEIQVSNSPTFDAKSIIFSNNQLINTGYIPAANIIENTTYYWRIRGFNDCGASQFTEPFTFHTVALKCDLYESTTEKNITASGTPTVVSTIPVPVDGTVNDVNVIFQGNHEEFNSLVVKLVSPKGTEITLLKNACLPSSYNFNITFDDQAPLDTVPCPPVLTTIKPFLPLNKLENEDLKGDWKLSVFDDTPQGGGKLKLWKLRACGNVTLKPIILERNTVLKVAPKSGGFVNDFRLLAVNDNKTAEQLKFTLVTAPKEGFIKINNTTVLKVGDTFTQAEITAAKLIYYNTNAAATSDYFYFIIEDGDGGFLGTPKFVIDINVNNPAVVADKDLVSESGIKCYPNPTHESINIQLMQPLIGEAQLQLYNVQGQLMRTQTMTTISTIMDISDMSAGVYLLKVNTASGKFLQRVVKQ